MPLRAFNSSSDASLAPFNAARLRTLDHSREVEGRIRKESNGVLQVETEHTLLPGTTIQIDLEHELLLGEVISASGQGSFRVAVDHAIDLAKAANRFWNCCGERSGR